MTSWTPEIRIEVLPPNVDHSTSGTILDGLIDYSINVSRGASDYISAPYPGSSNLTLLFDENVIPDIQIGSWIVIEVKNSTGLWQDLFAGNVTTLSSRYRYYGLVGFVLEWQISLTSGISILQNTSWYNSSNFTGTTEQCFVKLSELAGRTLWNQVNSNTSWKNIGPSTWGDFDDAELSQIPFFVSTSTDTTTQVLTAGTRNVWDDLVTLTYGLFGFIYELPNGDIRMFFPTSAGTQQEITQDLISPDLYSEQSVDELRNVLTITKWDDTSATFYENESVSLYNERSGSLNTFLDNDLDVANTAQKMLNGLSYPILATKEISVNLLNPNLGDQLRFLLMQVPLLRRFDIDTPVPMGGPLTYFKVGQDIEVNK